MAERKRYQVKISTLAYNRLEQEVLTYLITHFSLERAYIIYDQIMDAAMSLNEMPYRGRREDLATGFKRDYKFIIYKETRNLEIKIIYFINEEALLVNITDFFPVLKAPQKITSRS